MKMLIFNLPLTVKLLCHFTIFFLFCTQVFAAAIESPELAKLPMDRNGIAIRYGHEIFSETALVIGPHGKAGHYARHLMSCQNCHLDGGARPSGNSLLDTHALYPQYREREGTIQTLADRVNTCLQHNLMGKPLPLDSTEMRALLLYFKWLGRGRPVLEQDPDNRLPKLDFLDRSADPKKGQLVYEQKCLTCHGQNGSGRLRHDGRAFEFPPLWGAESFSLGTSLSRLSLLARFVWANMPYENQAHSPKLTAEEAWDVSSYVLSKPRPNWAGPIAFQNLDEKPFDYPIGPYSDSFDSIQHLLGPFKPILDYWTKKIGKRAANATSGM